MIINVLSWLHKKIFYKFLISGGVNTILTYVVYIFLLMFLPYVVSYTMSYIFGVVCAYISNRFFVFKKHQGLKSVALLFLIYIIQYVLGVLILWFWVEQLGFAARLAPLVAIIVTVPVTYVLSKLSF